MMGSSGGGLDWVVLEPKWNGGEACLIGMDCLGFGPMYGEIY
jgi:hypothetical protein